jgi:2-polyprenyl-6-hydroxyphenyl methylase/3-demethylubiquinone-9 3-methyltransferase
MENRPGVPFQNLEAAQHSREAISFSFGANWRKYVDTLEQESVRQAIGSLEASFAGNEIAGQGFLDIGSGSGLFSLSAYLLGANPVMSIDIDPNSIECTTDLRTRASLEASGREWSIRSGSILDEDFTRRLPRASRVFSWGVLHHTGAMWKAIENTLGLIEPGGLCCLALYNRPSRPKLMLWLKRSYNGLPSPFKPLMRFGYGSALAFGLLIRGQSPIDYIRSYPDRFRGMSFWRDVEDWLGGLPYEFADANAVTSFIESHGYILERVQVRSPGGNNEYLIRRPI